SPPMLRRPPWPPLFPYTTLFRSGRRHRASRAGSDHSRLGSGQLGEAASRTTLQVQHVDEMLPCLHLGLTNFRELQRPTQVSPRRSEEHTSELQSLAYLVCRLLLE